MKKILSSILVLAMLLTMLPATAFAGTANQVSDYASLNAALTSSANGTIVQLTSDISYSASVTVLNSLTLDLNGYTLTFTGTGVETKALMTGIRFSGSGTFTVTDSGTEGKIRTTETYSVALENAGSGIMELADGVVSADQEMACAVVNSGSGTLKLSGANLHSENFYAILNQMTASKLNMSSGTVSSDSSYALVNFGKAEISGGTISSNTGLGINNGASGSVLTVSGGTVSSRTGYAIGNIGNGNQVIVTGGTVSSESGYAIANFDTCEVRLSGGIVSAISGMAVANMTGGNVIISNGATVSSSSNTAIFTNDRLTITGGTVYSVSGIALVSSAPAGSEVTISGGILSSTSGYSVANCAAGSMIISGTAVLSTSSGAVALLNQGTGTARINGGTLTANMAELYNLSTGKIEINAGTYKQVINSNASGSIVINGGSVKAVQGATPTNSAGTPLAFYGITLTNGSAPLAKDTPIATGELILAPVVSYGMNGVKTDASGTIYLWLPSTMATANYKSGSIDVSGGIVAGKTSVLPNYTARVTVKLNGATWENPLQVLLLTQKDSVWGADTIIADGNAAKAGGVYEFSGLKPGQKYYIWGNGTLGGLLPSGVEVTSSTSAVSVNFYDLKVTAGEGIDSVFLNARLIQGVEFGIQANVKAGYIFEKWVNTTSGAVVLTTPNGKITMDGKKDLTAYATLNTYNGSVTLNKDGSVWANSNKTVTLSTSATSENAVGFKTLSINANGVYSYTGLSPLATYYIWMDGKYIGQTVTTTSKDATVDYYTAAMTAGTNISSVSGGGVYLKGTEITVSAIVDTGDYAFSRWQNTTGGALVSATNQYSFTVNSAVSFTAVGGATKYTGTVTLNKDGAAWTTSPGNIVLSTSSSALVGTVTGTISGNTYTFANLPGTGNYYVWDADTVTYTGKELSSTAKSVELEYFTVTVNLGSNVVNAIGEGTYLKNSNLTVTALAADYYSITGTGWTNGKYTINNISGAAILNPTAELITYNGMATVQKDGVAWTDTSKNITLSSSSTDTDANKLTATGASGVFTFASLDPTLTYYIWADGVYTGRVLSRVAASAVVDYYTVSVTATNTTVTGAGVYLAGSEVILTTTGVTAGYDFVGWYSGSTLLSTNLTYNIANLSSTQALIAKAINDYTATVVVINGVKAVSLKNGGTPIDPDSGTTGTFSGLDRSVTYNVYNNGVDTGKTVSKSAPSVTLRYYSVNLTAGPGISSVSGSNTYLEGSNVNISATVVSGYSFTGWKGTESLSEASTAISSIAQNYTLTAAAYKPYAGEPFNISAGSITISDSSTDGKIKVLQNGITTDDIDPSAAFTITGASASGTITIDAIRGATITLHELDILSMSISDGAGDVNLILSGLNKLSPVQRDGSAALLKNSSAALTIQSVDGTVNHSLHAIASGVASAGIGRGNSGGNTSLVTSNITINSGTITASGWGAGIGVYRGTTSNLTINGGIVKGDAIGSNTNHDNTVLSKLTITGGTVNAPINATSIGANNVIKGGSINGNISLTNILPTDGSNTVYKITLSTGLQNTDLSGRLNITKSGVPGFSYGTKDMWTTNDANGNVYLYLSDGTYTATLGSMTKTIVVGNANQSDSLIATYSVTTPAAVTAEGITASAAPIFSSELKVGATATVRVSFSGTAQKTGTYTVGLTGTGIGTVATQNLTVTKNENLFSYMNFSFPMPAFDVTDLALSFSFAETAKYSVSYYNGGTLLGTASYYEGEQYGLMNSSSLTKTGYTFGSWGVTGNQTMGTSDVIHTAVWTPNTYTVIFNNDGSTTQQNLTYDGAATALTGSFTKTGYTLSGWATAIPGPKVYSVNANVQNLSSALNGTVDLYAVWQAQTYSVSFANGGGTGVMAAQSFTYDIAQELTANAFIRTGYSFTGWMDGGTPYVNGQSITATGDITLTAQWAANSYQLVFNGNGANGGTAMANQNFSYDASLNLTSNTFTREGYTFAGWATSVNGTKVYDNCEAVQYLTATQNGTVTLYAVWTPNSYSVVFNKNAVTSSGIILDQNHSYDTAQDLTPNAFNYAGYSFSGWNTEIDGSGRNFADKAAVKNLTTSGSITLYAQWSADTYSLDFNSSSGVGSMDKQNFATGDSGSVSDNRFVKPGYTFDGWNTKADGSGTNYAANATLMSLDNLTAANPTLYAKWKANSYTVDFNANSGAGSMTDQSFTYDTAQALTANSFTRGSDTFLGWSTSSTAEAANYTNGQSVSNLSTMADGKVTLYAVWKANTYEVRFDGNGGSGDMLPQTIGRSTATILNTNSYTRSGYSFTGWNTSSNGSGLSYANEQEVTNLPGDTANSIILYAQWTENTRYNLSGIVRESGGALLLGATVKLMQGSTIVAQTKTGTDGSFFFGNLRTGSYNLVASMGERTVTLLVNISEHTIKNVVMPAAATNNSVLIVTNEPQAEKFIVMVGGLAELAESQNKDITMTVVAKAASNENLEQLAIKEISGSQTVGAFLEMTVQQAAVTQTSIDSVLELLIPLNFTGKREVNIYRYHGGEANKLTELAEKPVAPFTDGCFYLDAANGLIYLYAAKFSTYAISYTPFNTGSSGTNDTGNNSTNNLADSKIDPINKPDSSETAISFPFIDISEKHWAREAISWANKSKLLSGTTANIFSPNIGTTRGMMVTVLWRLEQEPVVTGNTVFKDILNQAYYRQAVTWASENSVVEGYSDSIFAPDKHITREQMAAILFRYAELKGYDVSKKSRLNSFVDGAKTKAYAKLAMEWAVANKLITGKPGGLLEPGGKATRAEVAVIFMRFAELFK